MRWKVPAAHFRRGALGNSNVKIGLFLKYSPGDARECVRHLIKAARREGWGRVVLGLPSFQLVGLGPHTGSGFPVPLQQGILNVIHSWNIVILLPQIRPVRKVESLINSMY